MCRALLYLGEPVVLDDVLFQPESSLVNQAYRPRMLHMLNLAGFGMLAWSRESHDPDTPFRYASPHLPVFDRNLKALAGKVRADCLLAHVRGVAYTTDAEVSEQNTHPFRFEGCRVALAHNGDLHRIAEMKPTLLGHIAPELVRRIRGTTDSEWIYALLLSQLRDPYGPSSGDELIGAVERTLAVLRDCRRAHGIAVSSAVNLFITNGSIALGVRYCFDFGRYRTDSPDRVHEANLSYLSLWYTTGRDFGLHEGEWKMVGGEKTANAVIVASEPLTHDTATWLEVPEYSVVHANLVGRRPVLEVHPLAV